MPKFLVSVILIILASFGGLLYLVFKVHPIARFAIPVILFCLFTFLSYTIALILFLKAGRERRFTRDQKGVFRRKLKKGFLTAALITFVVAIKIFVSSR